MGANLVMELFIPKRHQLVESAYYCVGRHSSTRVDAERTCCILLALKKQGTSLSGKADKSLPCDPGSKLRLSGNRTSEINCLDNSH